MISSSIADVGVFAIGRIPGNPTILQTGLVRPFISVLGFPSPHNPPLAFLIRNYLRFPEFAKECLILGSEAGTAATLASARSFEWRSFFTSIKPSSNTTSIEIPRTVSFGERPFSYNSPQRRTCEAISAITCLLDMLIFRPTIFLGK